MHTIRCEIDTEYRDAEALADLAWCWLVEGAERLEGESFREVLDSAGQVEESVKKSVQCGPPGSLWGFLNTDVVSSTGRVTNRSRVLTRKNLPMLRKWLALDVQLAETAVYRLDDRGMPGEKLLRMGIARDESSRGWVRLSAETSEASFEPAAQARMTELLRDFSQEVDPSYAQVGYSLSLGRTEHEERVGPPLHSMTLPQSRRLLRGYEWLMVIPREIAAHLGGGDGIAVAGDFHRVETLRDGAVLLQVTPEFDGFTGEAIERTWRLLRPALRPGMPKRFRDSDPVGPPSRIWYADIA
ncbi:hypothetical protein ACFWBN_37760 [Streptomyces sp. NPDC059989]|uniref:hypothetical protein n=1 Tax=Streptomyces sp. NPDC059989 TaxID=3347026 RepID=UPI00367A4A13